MSMSNSDPDYEELTKLFEQPLVHKPGEPAPQTSKEEGPSESS